jgi:hypothetical protein
MNYANGHHAAVVRAKQHILDMNHPDHCTGVVPSLYSIDGQRTNVVGARCENCNLVAHQRYTP